MQTVSVSSPPIHRDSSDRLAGPARVLAILAAVARFGILTSEQIARLDGGSRQKCVRYLQRLVELKLLRKVERGHDLFLTSFFDARPNAFAITAKGLRMLTAEGILIPVSPKRADVLIAHEVEKAEAMFDFGASVAGRPDLRLIDQPEMLTGEGMPLPTRKLKRPLRLKPIAEPRNFPAAVRRLLAEPTQVGTEPDRLFVIAQQQGDIWHYASFGIELDRGGETILPKRLTNRPTWSRKTIGYVAAWSRGLHIEQWGEMCKSFRVLVITPSLQRARNIIELQREIGAPPGLFNFTSPDALREHGALAPIWMTAKSDSISLLDHA